MNFKDFLKKSSDEYFEKDTPDNVTNDEPNQEPELDVPNEQEDE